VREGIADHSTDAPTFVGDAARLIDVAGSAKRPPIRSMAPELRATQYRKVGAVRRCDATAWRRSRITGSSEHSVDPEHRWFEELDISP